MPTKVPFQLLDDIASQAEAEAGTATNKLMTPERTAQAIISLVEAALTGGVITDLAEVTPTLSDSMRISDADDSGNLKEVYLSALKTLLLAPDYTTLTAALTVDTTYTNAHGLGATPTIVQAYLECSTIDGNFAVGDRILLGEKGVTANNFGATVIANATNIVVALDGGFYAVDPSTNALASLTVGSWKLRIFAWK